LIAKCQNFIDGPGAGAAKSAIDLYVEARYKGQIWEIDVPLRVRQFAGPEDLKLLREDFDQLHEELFTFYDSDSEMQFVGWRATARCKLSDREVGRLNYGVSNNIRTPTSRQVYFGGTGLVDTRVEMFSNLNPITKIKGPAIIEAPYTTVVIDPGATVVREKSGSLVIRL
jgi:N-methylhydantoinase A